MPMEQLHKFTCDHCGEVRVFKDDENRDVWATGYFNNPQNRVGMFVLCPRCLDDFFNKKKKK